MLLMSETLVQLKKYVRQNKLTLREAGDLFGVNFTTIWRIMRGENGFTLATVEKLQKGLDRQKRKRA